MCIEEIMQANQEFKFDTAKLREISPFYPQILRQLKPNGEYVMSSNIRKEWQGKWYSVLLVQRTQVDFTITEDMCFARFIAEAYKVILFYKINGVYEEICPIQISEEERLLEHFKPQK